MEHNAKHFALQLGALISLYVSIGGLISLVFGIITIAFPDPANTWEYMSATSAIRMAIALLVVFFPTYLILTRLINRGRRETGASYLSITKWLIYLSLLVGGVVILGDLVSIIYNFLNGELTTRFLLKALTILVTVGLAFVYYLYDARGFWQTHETQSKQYGLGALVVVIIAVVMGYQHIEAPSEVREQALDQRQIQDLQLTQSYILNHYAVTSALPASLDEIDMSDSLPSSPEERSPYIYNKTSDTTFELCASFDQPSSPNAYSYPMYDISGSVIKNPDDWNHEKGDWCFKRVMNQQVTPAPMVK